MPTEVSAEGIRVELPDGAVALFGAPPLERRAGPIFTRAPVPLPAGGDLEPILVDALREQGMVQAQEIAIAPAPVGGLTRALPAGAEAKVSVPLAP